MRVEGFDVLVLVFDEVFELCGFVVELGEGVLEIGVGLAEDEGVV